MRRTTVDATLRHHILSLLEKGHTTGDIEESLTNEGHDAGAIRTILSRLSRMQSGRKQVQAVSLIVAGSILCLLCILLAVTAIFPHSGFYTALYGLSSVGALLVVAGLMMILI